MNIGEAIYDFFRPHDPLKAYYPGLKREKEGTYEEDFDRILKQMQTYDPTLSLQKIGITMDRIYKDPSYEGYRGVDFDRLMIQDMKHLSIEGLLFLPQFETWSDNTNLSQIVTNLLPTQRESMSLFYQINEKYVPLVISQINEKGLDPLHINSQQYGHCIAVKYMN